MREQFVLILCGPPGSGKTTIGQAISAEFGGQFVEASTVVKNLFSRERGDSETYMNYVARMFRSGGAHHFAAAIVAECHAGRPFVVLSGLRHVDEVSYVRKAVGMSVVVYLECSVETRRARKPGTDPVVQVGVGARDEVERLWGADEIKSIAEYIVNTEHDIRVSLSEIRAIVRSATNGIA